MEGCCPNLPPRSKHCFPGHIEHISGAVFTVYSFFLIYNLSLFFNNSNLLYIKHSSDYDYYIHLFIGS